MILRAGSHPFKHPKNISLGRGLLSFLFPADSLESFPSLHKTSWRREIENKCSIILGWSDDHDIVYILELGNLSYIEVK